MTKVITTVKDAMKLYGKEITKAWENGSIADTDKKKK